MTNKEQASEAYIKGKLRDHQEYLGCEEMRRMVLIQEDLYSVQQAFEDGWDEAKEKLLDRAVLWLRENVCKYAINVTPDSGDFKVIMGGRLWKDFKKAMRENSYE